MDVAPLELAIEDSTPIEALMDAAIELHRRGWRPTRCAMNGHVLQYSVAFFQGYRETLRPLKDGSVEFWTVCGAIRLMADNSLENQMLIYDESDRLLASVRICM